MTTPDKQDHAAVRVLPPAVPLATILAGAGLQWLWPVSLGLRLPAAGRYWLGGLIVVSAILLLGVWSVVLFRRSGQDANPWKPSPQIMDRGPYRLTRNPMYLTMVLVCIGFAIILWNAWILLLTPICAWVLQKYAIEPEEAYLEGKFGDAYLAYKRRVRRWI